MEGKIQLFVKLTVTIFSFSFIVRRMKLHKRLKFYFIFFKFLESIVLWTWIWLILGIRIRFITKIFVHLCNESNNFWSTNKVIEVIKLLVWKKLIQSERENVIAFSCASCREQMTVKNFFSTIYHFFTELAFHLSTPSTTNFLKDKIRKAILWWKVGTTKWIKTLLLSPVQM